MHNFFIVLKIDINVKIWQKCRDLWQKCNFFGKIFLTFDKDLIFTLSKYKLCFHFVVEIWNDFVRILGIGFWVFSFSSRSVGALYL